MRHFVVTGEWHTWKRKLHDNSKMQSEISTTAFANEEDHVTATDTSPVPASVTAASVSKAVMDVLQANSVRAGQIVLVSVPVQLGRKTIRKEYGVVVRMNYLIFAFISTGASSPVRSSLSAVSMPKKWENYFPNTKDDAWIVCADIVGHLDMAQMASRVFH